VIDGLKVTLTAEEVRTLLDDEAKIRLVQRVLLSSHKLVAQQAKLRHTIAEVLTSLFEIGNRLDIVFRFDVERCVPLTAFDSGVERRDRRLVHLDAV